MSFHLHAEKQSWQLHFRGTLMIIHVQGIGALACFFIATGVVVGDQQIQAQAKARAVVLNGFVVAVEVADPGAGYLENPTVEFEGGGGSGATAKASVANGIVAQVTVLSAGYGYTNAPTVTILPPAYSTLAMEAHISVHGERGRTYRVEYMNSVGSSWMLLSYVTLQSSVGTVVDPDSVNQPKRLYRSIPDSSLDNPDPERLVWFDRGRFIMGSPPTEEGRDVDEGPQTEVVLTQGFYIRRYEVTQAEFEEVMGSNPSWFRGPDLPVDQVLYDEAVTFCAKLTALEKAAQRLPAGYVYRLPTEAEWEYACRVYTQTPFSFGAGGVTDLNLYAWSNANSSNRSHPVGSKLPSPKGLYDMHGGIYEYCLGFYTAGLPGGSVTDPLPATGGWNCVIRGGSWYHGPAECRSASREKWDFVSRNGSIGFRPVLAKPLE